MVNQCLFSVRAGHVLLSGMDFREQSFGTLLCAVMHSIE
jgi:hypothetical protein